MAPKVVEEAVDYICIYSTWKERIDYAPTNAAEIQEFFERPCKVGPKLHCLLLLALGGKRRVAWGGHRGRVHGACQVVEQGGASEPSGTIPTPEGEASQSIKVVASSRLLVKHPCPAQRSQRLRPRA